MLAIVQLASPSHCSASQPQQHGLRPICCGQYRAQLVSAGLHSSHAIELHADAGAVFQRLCNVRFMLFI